MNIGLFSGSFNPIHNGHLIIAQECLKKAKLDKIIFIPSSNPPHKSKNKLAASSHRYRMTAMAVKDNPYFEIDPIEMYETKYSYETINHFKNKYSKDKIFFIIGKDAFINLNTWKKSFELLDMCSFIIINRNNYDLEKNHNLEKKHIIIDDINIDISSTKIRKYCKENKSIKYLVPANVEKYILNKKIYK